MQGRQHPRHATGIPAGAVAGVLLLKLVALAESNGCPAMTPNCNCDWTHNGTNCGGDDGSECFCRCCCPYKASGFSCKWTPPSPSPPSPPPPPPPPQPPAPLPSCSSSVIAGTLKIMEDGAQTDVYIIDKDNAGHIHVNGNSLTIDHGPRVYWGNKCVSSMTPDMFKEIDWEGKTLSYTVDLSKVGCGCNVAAYLVSMPASEPTKCGDYYCDANSVCGVACSEMDIQEANSMAWATTPHQCTGSSCSKGGCGARARDYGPGYSIDTRHPFNVRISMSAEHVHTELSQAGNTTTIDNSCSVGDAFKKGMVVTMSSWGGSAETMKWLDMPPCGDVDCNDGSATFSNFVIESTAIAH